MTDYEPQEFTKEELFKLYELLKEAYHMTNFHEEKDFTNDIRTALHDVEACLNCYNSYGDFMKSEAMVEHLKDQEASSEVTLEMEGEYISLKEYAAMHGITHDTVRQSCLRGRFKTARKIGRNWVINENEPFIDHRKK